MEKGRGKEKGETESMKYEVEGRGRDLTRRKTEDRK
jgi:hypothetical protein